MPSCAVLGCKTGYVPGKVAFQTFCFPTSNKLKQLWTEKVNRKNWEPNKYSRICAKHFGKEAYLEDAKGSQGRKLKRPKLRPYAYPTLYMKPTTETNAVTRSTDNSTKVDETEVKVWNNVGPQYEISNVEESFIADPTSWLGIDHDHQYDPNMKVLEVTDVAMEIEIEPPKVRQYGLWNFYFPHFL